MNLFRRKSVEEPYAGPRFGHVELDGRKIFLAGFTHGNIVVRPGKVPIGAARHLLSAEDPHVLFEGVSNKAAARVLKNKKLLDAEPIEAELAAVLRDRQIRASLKATFGFNPHNYLRLLRFISGVASPILLFSKQVKRNRDEIFRGISPGGVAETSSEIRMGMGRAFNAGSAALKLEKFWHLAGDFRSFLMADAILQRHASLPLGRSIALFSGRLHSPQVAAFLLDKRLFNDYKIALPAPLAEIHRRVSEARMRRER